MMQLKILMIRSIGHLRFKRAKRPLRRLRSSRTARRMRMVLGRRPSAEEEVD